MFLLRVPVCRSIFLGFTLLTVGHGVFSSWPASGAGPESAELTITDAIGWLPIDTETLVVANGGSLSQIERRDALHSCSLDLALQVRASGYLRHFCGRTFSAKLHKSTLLFAIEGSRKYRLPRGLGQMRFEGCQFAVFKDDLGADGDDLMRSSMGRAIKRLNIGGTPVAIFREQSEDDELTLLFCRPRPNVLVCANDEEYLRTALKRMESKNLDRALPPQLGEWRHLDTKRPFWAVRHYATVGQEQDPSSPLADQPVIEKYDARALGIAVSQAKGDCNKVTLMYHTGDSPSLETVRARVERLFDMRGEIDVIRKVEPGVFEVLFLLSTVESEEKFDALLGAYLGRGVLL